MIAGKLLFLLAIIFFLGSVTTTTGQIACSWNQEELFVIPDKISKEEEQVLEKLLDKLVETVGGAIPQVNAVKTAIEKLGPGGDNPDVVVIYACTDNAGKVRRKRDKLGTEAVLWGAKMNLASGGAKAERDKQRQKAIDDHKPKTSCCPPKVPPIPPTPNPPGPQPPGPKPPTPKPTVDPCKVPPPCPECKTHYDKLVAACERIEEIDKELRERIRPQLKSREDREKEETGKVLENLKKEIADLTADKQKLEAEKTGLQTAIRTDTANMQYCQKTRCNKTLTGQPPARGFDPCLVGTWRSVQATSEFNHWANGGEGVIWTIGGDGNAAIDYTKMRPNVVGERTRTWGGKATGRLSASNNKLAVTGTTSEVTITYTGPGLDGQPRAMSKNGLGNLLQEMNGPGMRASYSYSCDATTLVITGFPWSSTWKRVGTLP